MREILMYILFAAGLLLIIKGGDWFVESASRIAEILGVPKFVIGATIVSVATTLPEMIVSIQATAKGNVDMATGNAVGSVTANTALILGLFIVCMPFAVKRKEFAPKGLLMFFASVMLIVGCIFTQKQTISFEGENNEYYFLSTIGAVLLLGVFLAFFAENLISLKARRQNAIPEIAISDDSEKNDEKAGKKEWGKNILLFVLGAAGIVFGADLLVDYGTEIAISLGISQRVISIVAIAIGTSLPELVTTVTAIRKKAGALSVGNILGANIIDLTLILPLCALVSQIKETGALAVSVSAVKIDMFVCLGAVAIAVFPTIFTKKFSRWQGVVLLAGYSAYVISVFA